MGQHSTPSRNYQSSLKGREDVWPRLLMENCRVSASPQSWIFGADCQIGEVPWATPINHKGVRTFHLSQANKCRGVIYYRGIFKSFGWGEGEMVQTMTSQRLELQKCFIVVWIALDSWGKQFSWASRKKNYQSKITSFSPILSWICSSSTYCCNQESMEFKN